MKNWDWRAVDAWEKHIAEDPRKEYDEEGDDMDRDDEPRDVDTWDDLPWD